MSREQNEASEAWITHSTGRFVRPVTDQRPPSDLSLLRRACPETMTSAAFYALIESMGYRTGPSLQCIREINKGNNESFCHVEAPQPIDEQAVHPGLIDSLLQTVLPACQTSAARMLTAGSVLIPLHMARVRVLGSLAQPLHVHTKVQVSHDAVRCGIVAHDAQGGLLLEIDDFLLKQTDRRTLYQDMRVDDRRLIHVLDWSPLALPTPPAKPEKNGWIVVQSDEGWCAEVGRALKGDGAEVVALSADEACDADALQTRLAGSTFAKINLLFAAGGEGAIQGELKPISAEDTFAVLEAARQVVIIPGYGMAVSQAQHVVRELAEMLEKNGAEVRFAIHPVAGRMPGHMNVLLAEASVPYEQLVEMDAINPVMPTMDVAIVIGANDVVNPAAARDKSSPIYGMPIINAHEARTVICLKRGKGTGFSGLENQLFLLPNTRMLYGDAKGSLQGVVSEFKNLAA